MSNARRDGVPRALAETARAPLGWMIALGASFVAAVLVGLPVLPVTAANEMRKVNPDLVETYGWPEFTDQVAAAAASLPAEVPIFTSNYGEVGALTILGPDVGLNRSVYSGHNNYALWGPPDGILDVVLCVGEYNSAFLRHFWSEVRMLALIKVPEGVQNEEAGGGAKIFLCQQPRGNWAQMWPYLRHLN